MTDESNQRLIEQLYDDAAEAAADDALQDPEMLTRGELMAARALQQLEAGQRALLAYAAEQQARRRTPSAVRPSLLAMARSALIAHLERLEAAVGGQLVLQHRDLASMPDEDLRSLIVDIESMMPPTSDEPLP